MTVNPGQYANAVAALAAEFQSQPCPACGLELDRHVIRPGSEGMPAAACPGTPPRQHWVIALQGPAEPAEGDVATRIVYTEGVYTLLPGQTRQEAFRHIRNLALAGYDLPEDHTLVTAFVLEANDYTGTDPTASPGSSH
jgi:hypothetical protein